MYDALHYFFFGLYPYICVTILLFGSWIRFEGAQYTWRSGFSELLRRRSLVIGSNVFHIGVLALVFGHLFGLLTPVSWYTSLGFTVEDHAILEVIAGILFGTLCLLGATILLWRRLTDERILRTSSWPDIWILLIVWFQLVVGMVTLPFSWEDHVTGATLLLAGQWAQGLVTFRGDAWELIVSIPFVYKLHIVLGLTIFVLTPFSRLIHIWSVPIWYLGRRYQVVRIPYRKGEVTPGQSLGSV